MISLVGHLRLGKLILLWDYNRTTDDGATSLSISEDVAARFRVAGWHVAGVARRRCHHAEAAHFAGRIGWTCSTLPEWSWYAQGSTTLVLF